MNNCLEFELTIAGGCYGRYYIGLIHDLARFLDYDQLFIKYFDNCDVRRTADTDKIVIYLYYNNLFSIKLKEKKDLFDYIYKILCRFANFDVEITHVFYKDGPLSDEYYDEN